MVRLSVIVGPMFAGKTTRLVGSLVHSRDVFGGNVVMFKHALDNERLLPSHSVETRSVLAAGTVKVVATDNLSTAFLEHVGDDVSAVAVDEAQFFDADDLVAAVTSLLKSQTRSSRLREIFVGGLDGTYKQEPFKGSGIFSLCPLADSFKKVSAACKECSDKVAGFVPAPFTSLLTLADDTAGGDVKIGGDESFKAVCRTCIARW